MDKYPTNKDGIIQMTVSFVNISLTMTAIYGGDFVGVASRQQSKTLPPLLPEPA